MAEEGEAVTDIPAEQAEEVNAEQPIEEPAEAQDPAAGEPQAEGEENAEPPNQEEPAEVEAPPEEAGADESPPAEAPAEGEEAKSPAPGDEAADAAGEHGEEGEVATPEPQYDEEGNLIEPPEPESAASPVAEEEPKSPVRTETSANKCIDWFQENIKISGYSPEMWQPEFNVIVNNMLETEEVGKVFFWIENETDLRCSDDEPPNIAKNEENGDFVYFIKPSNISEPITAQNIASVMITNVIDGNTLDSLISFMEDKFIQTIKRERKWPESVKKEFIKHMHRFMANIIEASHKQKEQTCLYVPMEDIFDMDLNAKDKELVQRLESTLIRWTRQIREVLNDQEGLNQENENAGPLQEIDHWNRRTFDLSRIHEQLEKPDLQNVIKVLRKAESSYLTVFEELSSQIQMGKDEADDNLQNLQILQEPCTQLKNSKPNEIRVILPDILDKVRQIWEQSRFYNTADRVTGLLRKISNEIINRCIETIDINDMLDGDVLKCMKDLEESKQCGESWKEIFLKVQEQVKEEGKPWEFNTGTIFAQVEAFVQRCVDLNNICEGQLQFSRKEDETHSLPHFGGTRGPEIVRNIDVIEETFKRHLDKIRQLKYNVLDVKITDWHTDYNKFKLKMKELESQFISITNFAFDGVSTVAQGVEMLEAFDSLAKVKNIKVHVQKLASTVYEKFMSDLELMKKEYDSRRTPPLSTHHPKFAGTALWARSLITRIERQKQILEQLTFITDKTVLGKREQAYDKYNRWHDQFKGLVSQQNKEWENEIEKYSKDNHLETRMEKPVFAKDAVDQAPDAPQHQIAPKDNAVMKRNRGGELECNYDKGLMTIVAEVNYWEKLQNFGVTIPSEVHDIAGYREEFRVLRDNVLLVVRDYNIVMDMLDDHEKKLFEYHIGFLNKKLEPGWKKSIRWNNKGIVDTQLKDWKSQCSIANTKVLMYKKNTDRLEEKFAEVCAMSFIKLDVKNVYEKSEFENDQHSHLKIARENLKTTIDEIKKIILETYEIFEQAPEMMKFPWARNAQDTVDAQWIKYIEDKDKLFEDNLKKAVRSALNELNKAINGDGKTDPNPIFKLTTILDERDQQTNYEPTRKELKKQIKRVIYDIIKITEDVPRIENIFYELKLEKEIHQAEQATLYAPPGLQGMVKNTLSVTKEEEKDEEGDESMTVQQAKRSNKRSFYEIISEESDIRSLRNKILRGIKKCSEHLEDNLREWMIDHYRYLWTTAQGPYIKRMRDQKPDIKTFHDSIENYNKLDHENIAVEKSTKAVLFVQIDNNVIKKTLVRFCHDWISAITKLLNDMSKNELQELHDLFIKSEEELTINPVDLHHLKRNENRLAELQSSLTETENRIDPVHKKYELLAQNEVPVDPEEEQQREKLDESFESWKEMLKGAELRLEKSSREFKREVELLLEEFTKSVTENRHKFQQSAPFGTENKDNREAQKLIQGFREDVHALNNREEDLRFGLKHFDITLNSLKDLTDVESDLDLLDKIWGIKQKWDTQWEQWKIMKFLDLDTEVMTEVTNDFHESVQELAKQIKTWGVWISIREKVDVFMNTLPLITDLRSKAIKDRHWRELKAEVKQHFEESDDSFTLDALNNLQLHQHQEFIAGMTGLAKQQLALEENIEDIKHTWESMDLNVIEYKNIYYRLTATDDLFQSLEENIVSLSSMKSQYFAEPFLDDIAKWEKTISQINENVDLLLQVQKQWMYLESIFVGQEDVKKQLANEESLFRKFNNQFMEQMTRIEADRNAQRSLCHPGFYEILSDISRGLESVQKSLDDFLENKRQKFPRFYFLSNEDLLAILGHSKDPTLIQPHIKKCFEGIKKLEMVMSTELKERKCKISGMYDPNEEYVPFINNGVTIEKLGKTEVEHWLEEVERAMMNTLKKKLWDCYSQLGPNTRGDKIIGWIESYPGQLVITAQQIKFTEETEVKLTEFETDPSKEYPIRKQRKLHQKYINKLVDKVRDRNINPIERSKLVALITIEQHNREILDKLVEKTTPHKKDFQWVQQLRFERDEMSDSDGLICIIRQVNTEFPYGYEYQGNNGRLVVTALTDRCYMTLTTALHLKRGGAPQGPAGTGKTETVKDLGKNMAKYVIVVNCSDQLDMKSLSQMFAGLAQSGAWGCFDEFNRIEVEVLSVVAQQISLIQVAIQQNKNEFRFENKGIIKLNPSCGIFVTMNPGYAGRSELPDNLKSLFRPMSMMKADLALICEIMLLSEGFRSGKSLAKKTVTLYRLMVQQFSKQDHYDYGMRALKSVLVCAGNLKRDQPDLDESVLLMKAIHDMNIPKWVEEDIPLFKALLEVIFYGVRLNESENMVLKNAIEAQLLKNGHQATDVMMLKVMQLYDTKRTRHGNMLVGQTLSGKSTIWKTLHETINALAKSGEAGFEKVTINVMNPKSITLNELYGWYDSAGEWFDGILSSIVRNICADESKIMKWFILDGPVDTLWIESMNSVLDDSKLLTLVNGDRIALPRTVRLLFEVENLAQASPATVSRCGMIYVDVKVQGYEPYYTSWLQKKDKEMQDFLQGMFDKFCVKLLEKKRTHCKELVPTSQINNIISLTKIFDVFQNTAGIDRKKDDKFWSLLEKWYIFAIIWSIGATVDEDGRSVIDDAIKDIDSGFPHTGTLYDHTVNLEKCEWMNWNDKLSAKYTIQPGTAFHKIIVPTIDTLRHRFLLEGLVQGGHNTLVVGKTGTGKTININSMLSVLKEETYCSFNINFSAQTSAGKTQEIIESSLEKRTSNKRGPPAQKRCVLFVDDLNMPRKDTFGTQPPLELLRQWVDYGYWYDRSKQNELQILDTQLMCAMGPPGGGRAEISQRFQACFNLLNFTLPSDRMVNRIYFNIIQHHFQEFEEEVKPLSEPLTTATITLYQRVMEQFLPTPTKQHYVFNFRDISKVFQGMYRADRGYHDSKESMLKLWVHECLRVFHDRLISYADRDLFKTLLNDQLEAQLSANYESCTLKITENDQELKLDPLFVDFLDDTIGIYEEVVDRNALRKYLDSRLDDYNALPQNVEMALVLFQEAIVQMCNINRVMKQTRGHCLLVGVGGSGRHSLTRLATYIAGYDLVQLEINKEYSISAFKEDIKRMNERAGVTNKPVVFLFSDNDVVNEAFLEDVNNILSQGEVPNIYSNDEMNVLRESVRKAAREHKIMETPEKLFEFFMSRVRDNLHVSFCISPIGDNFRNYLRMYPGLVNNTTINWFMPWPQDALYEVAQRNLTEKSEFEPEMINNLSDIFCQMHVSVSDAVERYEEELKRTTYVTPTNYLELVNGYLKLLADKQKEVGQQADKLRNGLGKLEGAGQQVAEMSVELEAKKSEVSKKQRLVEELAMNIKTQTQNAEKAQKEVERESEKIEKESKEVNLVAEEAQRDLDKALPALQQAEAALELLDKQEIAEVKAYSDPPPAVMEVMEAVMIVFGQKADWATAKKELADPNFLKRVKEFDKENMKDQTLKRIEKYTKRPNFTPVYLKTVSGAASALCLWIQSLEIFAKCYRDVEPKRQNLAYLQANLHKMEERRQELMTKWQEMKEEVALLSKQAEEAEIEADMYKNEANELQIKLERAEKLVQGLAVEKVRWQAQLIKLDEEYGLLPGDSLLSAAFMSYCGPFTSEYRNDLLEETWLPLVKEKQIPKSLDYSFISFMSKPTEVRDWNIQKLPTDQFSTENGILATKTRLWPLMIDPQNQANAWIRNLEGKQLKIADPKENKIFMRRLEKSIRLGLPMLFQDIEEDIDPSLDPVLNQSIQKRGTSYTIKLGDKELAYSFDFKFYMTTKMANPTYPPEISTKVTLINFQVKEYGLEQQLLGIVVAAEERKLEEETNSLIEQKARNEKILVEKEDEILSQLNNVQGSLLDDTALIDTLQVSKEVAENVKAQLETSEITMKKNLNLRENYRPCAAKASALFFVLAGLVIIDPMYQFSLESYIELFKESIRKSKDKNPIWENIADRIVMLDKFHMQSVYSNTCMALFERHKLLLSMQMCIELAKKKNEVNMEEYDFFLRGGVVLGDVEQTPNPDPEWISNEMWDNITELNVKVETFANIESALVHSRREWKRWYQQNEPESQPLPGEWDAKADDLRKLVLLRCLRPDRVIFAVKSYVSNQLGGEYVDPPNLDLDRVVKESSKARQPLIFVLHPGVDPSPQLQFLAKEKERILETIPLGKGQASKAIAAFNEGCEKGFWVFLANCHLSLSWMPDLEKLIEEKLDNGKPHDDFRLWLSSDPNPKFPISILQRSIKMTTEPPRGIKANMLRLYGSIKDTHFNKIEKEKGKYKKLLYSLCWYHSILIERKKFKSLGWNIMYTFNDSDFEVCENIIAMYLGSSDEKNIVVDTKNIPWDAICYLIGEVSYGGRVTDERDRKLMKVYTEYFFQAAVVEESKFMLSGGNVPYMIPDDTNYKLPPDITNPAHFYKMYIKDQNHFPTVERPEAFGQHVNAEIASQRSDTKDLLASILTLQPQVAIAGAESKEDKCYSLATVLLDQIPATINYDEIKERWKNRDESGPLRTVLLQEISRYNKLLNVVAKSLKELQQGIRGLVVISVELEAVMNSVYENKTPTAWLFAYKSIKPLISWIKDLEARIKQLHTWGYGSTPTIFWISGFTFPTGFTTALKQQAATRQQCSIDQLVWEFNVQRIEEEQITTPASSGAYVKGLFLEGAKWDIEEDCLITPEPMELTWPMPVILFKPVKDRKKKVTGLYKCPCYIYPIRQGTTENPSYMFSVNLKSGENPAEFWIKRGTALLMQLDI